MIMRKLGLCSFVGVILLSGCAPATMKELRLARKEEFKFQSGENYQPVYRVILDNARRCYQAQISGNQRIVRGDLYTDLQAGEVSVSIQNNAGNFFYLGVDVSAVDQSHSSVTVYMYGQNSRFGELMKAWVEKTSEVCSPSDLSSGAVILNKSVE